MRYDISMARGRPKKEIDANTFESLCGIQCTQEEICQFFDVTDKTLNGWCKRTYGHNFSEVFAQKRGLGRISLRRAGFKLAQKNPSVHIFYAKNFLGMTDKQEQIITTVEDLTPLADVLNAEDTDDIVENICEETL